MKTVSKTLFCFVVLILSFCCGNLYAQSPQTKSDKLNGYPISQYYHQTVKIPASFQNSTAPEDRVKVLLHNKMVAYEKENKRPINSLPKNDLENLLARLDRESREELGLVTRSVAPEDEVPAAKPSIIGEDR